MHDLLIYVDFFNVMERLLDRQTVSGGDPTPRQFSPKEQKSIKKMTVRNYKFNRQNTHKQWTRVDRIVMTQRKAHNKSYKKRYSPRIKFFESVRSSTFKQRRDNQE